MGDIVGDYAILAMSRGNVARCLDHLKNSSNETEVGSLWRLWRGHWQNVNVARHSRQEMLINGFSLSLISHSHPNISLSLIPVFSLHLGDLEALSAHLQMISWINSHRSYQSWESGLHLLHQASITIVGEFSWFLGFCSNPSKFCLSFVVSICAVWCECKLI